MKLPNRQKTQFSLVYLFIALMVVFAVQSWLRAPRTVDIPMSQFLTLVHEGKVLRVSLGEREIQGILKPGALPAPPAGPGDRLRQLLGAEQGPTVFTTARIPATDDYDVVRELQAAKVEFSGRIESTFWRDVISWLVPLVLMAGLWLFLMRRMGGGPTQALSFGRSKAKIYDRKELKTTFADVAGVDEAKAELMEVVDFLKNPKKYQRLGGRIPKGVLLVGPPGTGKTLLARAVAGEADVPFFFLSGSEFVEMFVGVGASRVRDLFEQAKEKAPCIVFIDELDAIGKTRAGNTGFLSGHDEREQTLNQLLAEMDGFDSSKGVIIMAATNRPEVLDAALLRAGRFDRQVVVDKPDVRGREAILIVHARNVKLAPSVDLHVLAARTPGMAGADLANIINEAALLAARKGKDAVDMADLEEAVDRVVGGLERKSRVLSEKERDIVAHHEIGHALVASSLPNADPVHKVTIIPRGVAALGATYQLPLEDRYLLTRSELEDRIAVLLGGRVAEEIIYGEVSTGAHNDLERGTELARLMVMQYGMSEALGPMTFGGGQQSMFLRGSGLPQEREYSEESARRIDSETRAIIDRIYDRVRDLLTARKRVLVEAATELKQKETLEGDRLRELLAGEPVGAQG
ncbi:MAG TPA: ATP-dependent zinc metalloprotease FtsH [Methylomirabilota bacterium]|jgi:cell division protease FtsH|nr:ATP-dependent zinc metalloprotease FtsH [Methylomirabilota bacterium]